MYPSPIILPFRGKTPKIAPNAFLAPGVIVIGDVEIGPKASIWHGCVIRGDVHYIRIGAGTNIQDNSVVHVSRNDGPTIIGAGITIGHMAILHACILEDGCFIGMHSTVMDKAVVESGAMVAAGALIAPHKKVPKGEIWGGNPGKFMRPLKQEETDYIKVSEGHYRALAEEHRNMLAELI